MFCDVTDHMSCSVVNLFCGRLSHTTSTDEYMLTIGVADTLVCGLLLFKTLPFYATHAALTTFFGLPQWTITVDAGLKFSEFRVVIVIRLLGNVIPARVRMCVTVSAFAVRRVVRTATFCSFW